MRFGLTMKYAFVSLPSKVGGGGKGDTQIYDSSYV